MRAYLGIFNWHSLLILFLALASSLAALQWQLSIHLDFLVLGLLVVFPLTLTIKEAFKRRERAIQYLSAMEASLRSFYYCFANSKLDPSGKQLANELLYKASSALHAFLTGQHQDIKRVSEGTDQIANFITENRKVLKGALSQKLMLSLFRARECANFLVATKRHHTPLGIRSIALIAIYSFVIFYPASVLDQQGFQVPLWYLFAMTAFKAILLISLFNVQVQLEDPFRMGGPDSIKLMDFELIDLPLAVDSNGSKMVDSAKNDDEDEEGEVFL